jgi:hypothetical protein
MNRMRPQSADSARGDAAPNREDSEKLISASLSTSMKLRLALVTAIFATCLTARAGAPEDKAFTEKYKAALEGKDTATLQSFLYTKGSAPEIVEFYKMMQSANAGGKISKIELVNLTADEMKKASGPHPSPTGADVCLTLPPTKKLVISVEVKEGDNSSSSTSSNFVAEKDGKLVIPVPGPCK